MAYRIKIIQAKRALCGAGYTQPEPRDSDRTRKQKSRATSESQKIVNERNQRIHLAMLIDNNFTGEDFHVVFTFDDAHLPAKRAGAVECFKKFIRKLRRQRERRGECLGYIYVVGVGKKNGRLHLHVILSGSGRGKDFDSAEIQSLWELGLVHLEQLNEKHEVKSCAGALNVFTLAKYLLNQYDPERKTGQQAFVTSKGLLEQKEFWFYVPTGTNLRDVLPPDFCPTSDPESHEYGAGKWQFCEGVAGEGWQYTEGEGWAQLRPKRKGRRPNRKKPRGKPKGLRPPP